MMRGRGAVPILAAMIGVFSFWAAAQEQNPPARANSASMVATETAPNSAGPPATSASSGKRDPVKEMKPADDATARVEGEKRFKANCGRCHAAPQKFPPRAMATIVRHMRVRATITDEDMRLILRYMTQ
jgi:mono/diheme cytochrome c family protein